MMRRRTVRLSTSCGRNGPGAGKGAVFSKEQRGGLEREKAALEQARLLLADCTLFSSLSADERSEIAARARIRSLEAGETVFAAGAPGNHMMALLSGNIRISISSADGKELLLAIIQPGEVFGELTVLDGKVRSADAVAETPCMLAMLYRQDILSFFEKNPSAWPKLIEVLCQRLRRTNQAFAEVALLQLPVRLARALLRVADAPAGSASAEMARTRFSQRELASMVGGTRESVNRCLRNWQRSGIVAIADGSIIVVDRPALENMAEPT
jgi:CRP/FNR family cyclic AMP-dependent transcriptional regulator